MSTIETTHERINDLLGSNDIQSNIGKMRFGIALFAMTAMVWLSYVRIFAERAVKQTGRLLVTLTFLVLSSVMYHAVMWGYDRFLTYAIDFTIRKVKARRDVGDKLEAAIGIAIGIAAAYAAYRVAKWALDPYYERVQQFEKLHGHDGVTIFADDDDEPDDDRQPTTGHQND